MATMLNGFMAQQCSLAKFQLAVVSVVCTLCYISSLHCDFVFDDQSAIKSNRDIRPTTPISEIFLNDFWGTPMTDEKSHGSYRPLCVLTFRLNYLLSELEPMSYHLVNIILHVIVSLLTYLCLKTLEFSQFSSWVAAFLFALHPIHTEAVAGVVGRAELLAAIFFLSAIICYALSTKSSIWGKIVLVLAAVGSIPLSSLSKETGITVAGLLIVYEIIMFAKWQPRFPFSSMKGLLNLSSLFRLVAVVGTTCFFLFVRLKLMPQMPHFSILDNPAAHAQSPAKQLTFAYLVPVNAMLLLYPWPLVADWALGTVPLVEGFFDERNIVTTLFFITLFVAALAIAFRTQLDRHVAFCFALIIVPFIPASNLFFPVGFVVAERVLYLPSIGWCALIALGFERILAKFSRFEKVHEEDAKRKVQKRSHFDVANPISWFLLTLTIVLVAFFFRSFLRNFDWADQVSLFRSGLRFNQRNAKLFNNVGHTYEGDGKWDEAFSYFYKAVRTHPTDVGAHRNCARALRNLNQPDFAQRCLRRAIRLIPSTSTVSPGITKTRVTPAHLDAFLDLASLLAASASQEMLVEAEDLYSKVLAMRPDYLPAYERRGEIMFKLGRLDEARRMFKEGLAKNPQCANCYYNLAVVDITQTPNDVEKLSVALGLLDTAIQMDPEHYHAMHAFASVIQERRVVHLYERARGYLKRVIDNEERQSAKQTEPSNHQLMKNHVAQESAAKISDVYFRAAMLETDLRNFELARDYYLAALKRDPTAKSILFNLAWLHYKDLNKPLGATPFLKRLLKAYPNHATGWLLLGYVHMNHTLEYQKARNAFEKVIKVAPLDTSDQAGQATSIATAQFELCRLYEKEKQPTIAVKCLEELAKLYANDSAIGAEIKAIKKRYEDEFE